jgi:hypothetical protein
MRKTRHALLIVLLAAGGCSSGPTGTMLASTLTRTAVSPPCAKAGSYATGSASVSIDTAGTTITVSNFSFSGLSGASTQAGMYSGPPRMTGPLLFKFSSAASPISQSFTAADYTAPTGGPGDFPSLVAAVKTGQTYLLVDTALCTGGEIRGQIQ